MAKMAKMTNIIFFSNPGKFLLAIKSLGGVAQVDNKGGAWARGSMGSHMSGNKMRKIGQPLWAHPKILKIKGKKRKSPQFHAWNQCSTLLTFTEHVRKKMLWGGGVAHGGAQMKRWIVGFFGYDQTH